MEIIDRVREMSVIGRDARARGLRLGFVPTMGALHEGHLSLVRGVRDVCDRVVVSVFVNPTQFGPGEDYAAYPRDPARDARLCAAAGVDWLFVPAVGEMYPPGAQTVVEVPDLSLPFEGAIRPGHFRGVSTVVAKLFSVVQPAVAAFGQKDAQQVAVVRRMVRDLLLDVELLVLPIVRDADGVALSSRNRYLAPEERRAARAVPRAIEAGHAAVRAGERHPAPILAAAAEVLAGEALLSVDYLALVDDERFEQVTRLEATALLLVAVRVGRTRLLDNATLDAVGSGR